MAGRGAVSSSLSEHHGPCPPVGVETRGPSGLVRRPTASHCMTLGGDFISPGLTFTTI